MVMNFTFKWAQRHLVGDIQHTCLPEILWFDDQSVVSLGGSAASLSGAFGGRKSDDGRESGYTVQVPQMSAAAEAFIPSMWPMAPMALHHMPVHGMPAVLQQSGGPLLKG